MAFTEMTDDVDVIQALSQNPNETDGLSSAQLQAKFDEASNLLKTYINDVLLAELEAIGASADIGCTGTYSKLQDFIDAIELAGAGSIPPDDSLTTAKFNSAAFSTDTGLSEYSDTVVASQKAIKTYADTKLSSTAIDTDVALTANSDTKIASQKATKTYADTKISSSILTTRGDIIKRGASANERLEKGTAFQGIGVNSGATDIEYQETAKSILTAEGDILYADGANSLAKLAKGTEGQILKIGSSAPEWEDKLTLTYVSGQDTTTTLTQNVALTKDIALGVTPKFLIAKVKASSSTTSYDLLLVPASGTVMILDSNRYSTATTDIATFGAGDYGDTGLTSLNFTANTVVHTNPTYSISSNNFRVSFTPTGGTPGDLRLYWTIYVFS